MKNPFSKTFDELLDAILTDYKNLTIYDADGNLIPLDTSQGSLIFIKASCMASALWGIYQAIEWTGDQIFPDSAEPINLNRHGFIHGVARTYGETDSAYLARLLDYLRRPPAGGNRYDYVKWAKEVDNVAAAYCVPLAQGLGTVDVIILANEATTGSETPNQELIDVVKAYIDDVRPVTASLVRVLGPEILDQDVTMDLSGTGADAAGIASDIATYIAALIPGQTLYLSHLYAIAISGGAENVVITVPAADVEVTDYQVIRAGDINVT
jgi:uncharacterized phage protein gp47/JayE